MSDEKKIMIYYCKCGKSIQCAAAKWHMETDRKCKKDFKQAKEWGRKVEELTLEEYKDLKKPFMCVNVPDCPNKNS